MFICDQSMKSRVEQDGRLRAFVVTTTINGLYFYSRTLELLLMEYSVYTLNHAVQFRRKEHRKRHRLCYVLLRRTRNSHGNLTLSATKSKRRKLNHAHSVSVKGGILLTHCVSYNENSP